ncbi:casein kinase i-like protein [Anaeramoeba flamelloides]|uniref:non-specific serine/threonine protein kinase n=1 Tax=Anaeramoeba flamelloides TaxID=1746091 RepID=A0AAV7ZQY4_9EUKA|nr:casein kinase i-like protein [Anaeramoeba flamelloides]
MGNVKTSKKQRYFNEEETKETDSKKQLLVDGKYLVKKKIGSGSFGRIHRCVRVSDNEIFAAKFETERQEGQLEYENKIYKFLSGNPGIPNILHFGKDKYEHFLIMDYLGPNLESLFKYCNRKFSLKTVLMIADQILCRLQLVHSKSFVYRDIKPENFVIGRGPNKNQIYIIDFGLSKLYRDFWTHKLNKYRNKRDLVGTVRYSSINTHLGIEQSRRDDLESLGYMLIYLLKGRLPWQGFKASNKKERNEKICDKKVVTPLRVLCEHLPVEFKQYLEYCKNLSFEDVPNYSFLRKKFRKLFLLKGYVYDYKYDWKIKHDKESQIELKNSKEQENFNEKHINGDLNQTKIISNRQNEKNNSNKNNKNNNNDNNKKKKKNNSKSHKKQNKKRIKSLVIIEETESESSAKNEFEREKVTKKKKKKKIKLMEERFEFVHRKEDKKLKIKIENYLLRKQNLPVINESQQEKFSKYFLRIGEKYSLRRREMLKKIKTIKEILKSNPNFNDHKIEELLTSLKMELNGNLTINSFLFLENDLLNLLYLVNDKKNYLKHYYNSNTNKKYNDVNKRNINMGGKEIKKIKLKRKDKKLYLAESLEKKRNLIKKKLKIIEKAIQIRKIRENEIIFNHYKNIPHLDLENLSLKKLERFSMDLEKILILSKDKI